ncbi:hypothetical protein B0H63DRAFT_444093 [Podospora didyma]|uniref:Uncharacterized protein n=1 Tax=Podospora didyma TaxID=330526 RepID=A0AAE0P5X7_9PEZI|nr:hypothetical protein B0H63DRAFT_444093 [Podospora didyma]
MFGFKLVTIAALLAQGAFSAPAPAPAGGDLAAPVLEERSDFNGTLSKRGEGIHLFNCYPIGGEGVPQTWLSLVVYCANDADCSNIGYSPPSSNVCVKQQSSTPNSYWHWEGSWQGCTFSSGTTFSWNLEALAQNWANYSPVGQGDNGFRTFVGYKDDKSNGLGYNYHDCQKIYYFV